MANRTSYTWQPPVGSKINFSHPQSQGLVAAWLFNENGGAKVKDLVGTNDGTLNGAAIWRTAKPDPFSTAYGIPGILLDGSNSYVAFIKNPPLNSASNASISFWAWRNVSSDIAAEVGFVGTDAGRWNTVWYSDGNIYVTASNTTAYAFAAYNGTGWRHFVYTFNGADVSRGRLYANGVEIALTYVGDWSAANLNSSLSTFYVGRDPEFGRFDTGMVRDVRVYNKTLNLTEIQNLYKNPYAMFFMPKRRNITLTTDSQSTRTAVPRYRRFTQKPLTGRQINGRNSLSKGLLGYYPMNEQGGKIVSDLSGRNNNGTLTTALLWNNKGIYINGATNYIDFGTGPSVQGLAAYSFSFWFNVSTLPSNGNDGTIWWEPTSSVGNVRVKIMIDNQNYTSDSNALVLRYRDNDGNAPVNVSSGDSTIKANLWYHGVVIFDSNNNKEIIYLNGVQMISRSDSPTAVSNTAPGSSIKIGAEDSGGPIDEVLNGVVENVHVYNRALSPQEVIELYTHPYFMFTPIRQRRPASFVPAASLTNTRFQILSNTKVNIGAGTKLKLVSF